MHAFLHYWDLPGFPLKVVNLKKCNAAEQVRTMVLACVDYMDLCAKNQLPVKGCNARVPNEPRRFYKKMVRRKVLQVSGHVCTCGLADQCWVHKQKVGGSSPVTVVVLCL